MEIKVTETKTGMPVATILLSDITMVMDQNVTPLMAAAR